jgi:hypothetical protein
MTHAKVKSSAWTMQSLQKLAIRAISEHLFPQFYFDRHLQRKIIGRYL